jgi:hypothetical protein
LARAIDSKLGRKEYSSELEHQSKPSLQAGEALSGQSAGAFEEIVSQSLLYVIDVSHGGFG